jgi:nitrite reductase/ring-hydroxylating ferredoxin subunit
MQEKNDDRRAFIKKACVLWAGMAGGLSIASLLTSCVSLPRVKSDVKNNTAEIPLSSFVENKMVIIVPKHYYYDILVIKKSDTEYTALEMKCTHQDNMLVPSSKGLNCTLHGSSFDFNGKVTEGPAIRNLRTFPVEISDNKISVRNVPTDY